MKEIFLHSEIEMIMKIFEDKGYQIYLVGGALRNHFLSESIVDFDLVSDANIETIKEILKNHKCYIIKETIAINLNKLTIHISSFRDKINYNLKDDLVKRDFTINAIAYSKKTGLIDMFGGLKDLKLRQIRIIRPQLTFKEDPLRILRAIRLACQYDLKIEDNTKMEIFKSVSLLNNVDKQRIRDELNKIMLTPRSIRYLDEYFAVFSYLISDLKPLKGFNQNNPHHQYDVWTHTLKVVENIKNTLVLKLTALLHDIAKPLTYSEDKLKIGHFYGHDKIGEIIALKVLKDLKYPQNIIDKVTKLIRYHMYPFTPTDKAVKKLLMTIGEEDYFDLLELRKADLLAKGVNKEEELILIEKMTLIGKKIIKDQECYLPSKLKVNGLDLINIGIKKEMINKVKEYLLEMVISNKLKNEYEELIKESIKINKNAT